MQGATQRHQRNQRFEQTHGPLFGNPWEWNEWNLEYLTVSGAGASKSLDAQAISPQAPPCCLKDSFHEKRPGTCAAHKLESDCSGSPQPHSLSRVRLSHEMRPENPNGTPRLTGEAGFTLASPWPFRVLEFCPSAKSRGEPLERKEQRRFDQPCFQSVSSADWIVGTTPS